MPRSISEDPCWARKKARKLPCLKESTAQPRDVGTGVGRLPSLHVFFGYTSRLEARKQIHNTPVSLRVSPRLEQHVQS